MKRHFRAKGYQIATKKFMLYRVSISVIWSTCHFQYKIEEFILSSLVEGQHVVILYFRGAFWESKIIESITGFCSTLSKQFANRMVLVVTIVFICLYQPIVEYYDNQIITTTI